MMVCDEPCGNTMEESLSSSVCVVWLCEGSNSVWCGCVRGQTVCGVVV